MCEQEIYKCPICGSLITQDIVFVEAWQSYEENFIVCNHCKSTLEIKWKLVVEEVY